MNPLKIKKAISLANESRKKSNCTKRKVGAVLERYISGKIVNRVYGYNTHDVNLCRCEPNKKDPLVKHAEEMVLSFLKDRTLNYRLAHNTKLVLYVTYQPCEKCAELIVQKGVHKVYFVERNLKCTKALQFLKSKNVEVVQL